jgi:hypothetical protein
MKWRCLFPQEYSAASGMAKSSFDLSIVKSCHRWKPSVRDYLAAVLPGLADDSTACSRGAALAQRLKGSNITTDLMQVRKVVTGQQSYHHRQGLRAPLIVLPAALQVLW